MCIKKRWGGAIKYALCGGGLLIKRVWWGGLIKWP